MLSEQQGSSARKSSGRWWSELRSGLAEAAWAAGTPLPWPAQGPAQGPETPPGARGAAAGVPSEEQASEALPSSSAGVQLPRHSQHMLFSSYRLSPSFAFHCACQEG